MLMVRQHTTTATTTRISEDIARLPPEEQKKQLLDGPSREGFTGNHQK
jgi:hypothetical protein